MLWFLRRAHGFERFLEREKRVLQPNDFALFAARVLHHVRGVDEVDPFLFYILTKFKNVAGEEQKPSWQCSFVRREQQKQTTVARFVCRKFPP